MNNVYRIVPFILLLSFSASTFPAYADGINGTVGGAVGLFVNTNTEALHITSTGNVGIGSTSPVSSLDLSQKTDALALPVGTTGQEPTSSVAGMLRYNSTTHALEAFYSSAWNTILAGGSTPAAFSFTNQTGVSTSTTVSSNAVTLSSFTGIVSATCGANCTAIARNGVWGGTTVNGFSAGDSIAIRLTSSGSLNTPVTATVTAGTTVSGTWSVATNSSTPSAFSFTNVTGATTSRIYCSNAVTLSGFTGTLTATCTGCISISLNGNYGGTTVSGFASGNTIAICQQASSSTSTAVTASATVGNTTSSTWTVTTNSNSCPGVSTIGTTCPDGTVYAGTTPDGNVNAYVTPCDAGQSLVSGSCTGTRITEPWNGGLVAYYTTGYTNLNTGRANTNGLNTLGNTSDSPYQAAAYCATLSAFGHTDWYLPADSEGDNTYDNATNSAAIGGFLASASYWSSTEVNNSTAWIFVPSTGDTTHGGGKSNSLNIRCMRHD